MQSRFLKMDAKQQWSIFSQYVEKMVGEAEIQQKLSAGKSLRVKLGVDPTRPDLTFGHWVVFNKLRQLQELGHHIIFLMGDYTTQIGDPSGRSSTRPMLTREQIEEALTKLNMDINIRGEMLGLEEFARLSEVLK